MVYFQLRLTKNPKMTDDSKYIRFFRKILEYALDGESLKDSDPYVCSNVETRDKYGEETHPHYHLNFLSTKSKATIAKQITRKNALGEKWLGYRPLGNKMYSLQQIEEPEDFNRWMRYCVKMGPPILELTNWDYAEHMPLAQDEYKRSVESRRKRRAQREEKTTLYDKIEKHLKTMNLCNYRDTYMAILDYYLENPHNLNHNTISGYSLKFMLNNNLMTKDEFFKKMKHPI